MYQFWDFPIQPALQLLRPQHIAVVHYASDENTIHLLDYCKNHQAFAHLIDPRPANHDQAWQETYGEHYSLYTSLSLNAIPSIPVPDAVLLNGDHNWYTVYHELKLLENKCSTEKKPFPLVFICQLGWPYARRDQYFDPEIIPQAYRQPYQQKGLHPDSLELLEQGGFNFHCLHGIYENNLKSGVLTAVEDFLNETADELKLLIIPGLHGLGILYPLAMTEKNKELKQCLSSLTIHPDLLAHFEKLERNRLAAVIELSDQKVVLEEQAAALQAVQEKLAQPQQDTALQEMIEAIYLEMGRISHNVYDLNTNSFPTLLDQFTEKIHQHIRQEFSDLYNRTVSNFQEKENELPEVQKAPQLLQAKEFELQEVLTEKEQIEEEVERIEEEKEKKVSALHSREKELSKLREELKKLREDREHLNSLLSFRDFEIENLRKELRQINPQKQDQADQALAEFMHTPKDPESLTQWLNKLQESVKAKSIT